MKKDFIKKEKGAISTLVLFTVLMFTVILMGVYFSVTTMQKAQLKSDLRIRDLYGKDVEKVDKIYDEIFTSRSSKLKAGDYIKYDTGVEGVGVITCRVLYEANSEYGLQIISDKNVGPDITLGGDDWATGSTAYNSAIETLNNKAEDYLNTTYATDARCVGSLPIINKKTGMFTEKDKGTESTVMLPPPMPDGEDSNTWWTYYKRPSGWTSDDTGCYDADTNYTTDQTQMKNAGIWTTGEKYWLASRYVRSDSYYCYFHVRSVDTSGILDNFYLCYVRSDGSPNCSSGTNGLRPCFSLKSDIKITGGNGTEGAPYTM